MRRRSVVEFGVVARNSEPFDETKGGKQLGLFEKDLGENFLVKQIQAPGPKPDQVDQKNGEHDDQHRDDPERPFQNASEHAQSVARHTLTRSILYPLRERGVFSKGAQAASSCPLVLSTARIGSRASYSSGVE